MEIKLLKLLQASYATTIASLARDLKLSTLEALELIARINSQEPGLIVNHNGKYCLAASKSFLSATLQKKPATSDLMEPPTRQFNWLEQNLIHQYLKNAGLEYTLQLFGSLDSTNSYALNHSADLSHKSIISCEWQTAGRGRFGRSWHSLTGENIYFSARFPIHEKLSRL